MTEQYGVHKWLAFDIETDGPIPLHNEVPGPHDWPRILCIGVVENYSSEPVKLVYNAPALAQGSETTELHVDGIRSFIDYLWQKQAKEGYRIATWSGTGSDFRLLAALVPDRAQRVIDLALAHFDVPFMGLCLTGMMVGLDAVAKAHSLSQKVLKSKDVPAMWKKPELRSLVLDHVMLDAYNTLLIAQHVCYEHKFWWKQAGKPKPRAMHVPQCYSVQEALKLPLPFTPYKPDYQYTRAGCAAWMKGLQRRLTQDSKRPVQLLPQRSPIKV